MRRLVSAGLAVLLASAAAEAAKAEIVYQISADPNGIYKGPFALLSFAKVDPTRFSQRHDRLSLELNRQHYGFFGFGCSTQSGKIYYLRNATPPVGSQVDGPFAKSVRQEIAWKSVTSGLMLLEAKPGDVNFERIRGVVQDIRAQRGFTLLGVRENTDDPQDALGQVLACAAAVERKPVAPMVLAQGQ